SCRAPPPTNRLSNGPGGSRRHTGHHLEALRAKGVPEDVIARIQSPVGLDVGAVTPSEIALSILPGRVAGGGDAQRDRGVDSGGDPCGEAGGGRRLEASIKDRLSKVEFDKPFRIISSRVNRDGNQTRPVRGPGIHRPGGYGPGLPRLPRPAREGGRRQGPAGALA